MGMNIVSRRTLTEYGAQHPDAKIPLDTWYKVASHAAWTNLVELRKTYPSADQVGRLTVFNIGGNNYRLITKVSYALGLTSGTIYIRSVLTHAEYDKEGWKNDQWY